MLILKKKTHKIKNYIQECFSLGLGNKIRRRSTKFNADFALNIENSLIFGLKI